MITSMEQSIPKSARLTEDQYLRMEEAAKTRHEFRDGEIVDMAGGTEQHAAIAANLISELHARLKVKPCKPYGSDLRLRIGDSSNYVYPDVMVICGSPEFHRPPSRSTILNPRLVIEVTSASTEADDRGRKFSDYRTIDSLQEYLLVSQDRMEVETFYRQPDGIWAIGPRFTQVGQSVRLRSVEVEIPMAEIYSGIEFIPPPPKESPAPES
jgi:Uma2 family endonuclease